MHLDQGLVLAGVKVKYWRWTQAARGHFRRLSIQKKATNAQADISGPKVWTTSWTGIVLPWRVLWSCIVCVTVDIIDHFSVEEQLFVLWPQVNHQNIKHGREIWAFSQHFRLNGFKWDRFSEVKTHLNHFPQGTKIQKSSLKTVEGSRHKICWFSVQPTVRSQMAPDPELMLANMRCHDC